MRPLPQPLVNALLGDLGHADLQVVNLAYGYVGPKAARLKRERGLMGGTLVPHVRYRGHDPARPQELKRLRLLRNVVMNPYSHPLAPNIPTTEVQGAIAEVEKLIAAFAGKP